MASYKTPGVYVEEISTLPASVAQVATAIPAFIGYTEKSPSLNTPVRITSMVEYREHFGGPPPSITLNATGAFVSESTNFLLFYSMQMFFGNGGSACWVTSCGGYTPAAPTTPLVKMQAALAEVAKEDEPTLLLIPESMTLLSESEFYTIAKDMMAQCGALKDRFTLIDVTPLAASVTNFRTGLGNQNLSYGACYHPALGTTLSYPDDAVVFDASGTDMHQKTLAAALAIATGNDPNATPTEVKDMADDLNPILAEVRKTLAGYKVKTPATPAVAGVYARVDRQRGVWKAPANEGLTLVAEPMILFSNDQQKDYNDPTNGKAINLIRRFKGKGNLVWGARTLDATSLEWRYVPVRRLFIMVEESIKKATEPLVFEPNDAATWARVRAMIENFLTGIWRQGGLQGATPKDAFFVNAGLGTTMTPDDILNGYLNIEVGIAALRPAEFIILKFSHKLQES